MKKTLFALALAGVFAGAAQAQSHVTVYGIVDTGIAKQTGKDTYMTHNYESSLGFRGTEDLGNGYKAMFQLEHRLNLNDGTVYGGNPDIDWYGGANVGIGTPFGTFRLGRVDELPTETLRTLDPFNQDSIASMTLSTQRSTHIDNTIRYDSPNWSGFHFGATYSLGDNMDSDSRSSHGDTLKADGADNDGYGIMLGYDNGPLALVGNWSRLADSKKSSVWNLGAAYRFGPAKVELLYQQTKDKGWAMGDRSTWNAVNDKGAAKYAYGAANDIQENQWLLGLEWKLGPGRLNASAQWMEVEANGGMHISDKDIYKYAIGYTYDLSKRTAIYGNVAYTDYDDKEVAAIYGDTDDGTYGVQIGITHKF